MIGILAAEGPNGYFIPSDINELYWGSLSFGIIFVIFLWKGVPAISKAMKARTAGIEAELAGAAAQKSAAEAELATLSGELGDADAEAARIIADARDQATKLEADLLARAEADVVDSKERSRIEIQAQRDQALADLRAAVAEQARVAADAVVRQNLGDAATQSALIDDYISQLAR
ncbi:MAG: hypothetical protein RIB98_06230 [Acidimicrobiales bacterium]